MKQRGMKYSKIEELKSSITEAMSAYADSLNDGDNLNQDGRAGEDWWDLHLDGQQVSVGLMEWMFDIDIEILGAYWHIDDNGEGLWWYELDDIGYSITVSNIHCYTQSGLEVQVNGLASELERSLEKHQEMTQGKVKRVERV